MRQFLKSHPHSRGPAGTQVEVEATRPHAHGLVLSYVVSGSIDDLCLPAVAVSTRSDGLWRHTCFEAFVRGWGSEYCEFNFAPTTQWAAYRFSGYRSERRPAEIYAPVIEVQSGADRYMLQVLLQLDPLSGLLGQTSWQLGLSALIEDKGGSMSYWALSHPPGRPDFHHADSFACELLPMVQG